MHTEGASEARSAQGEQYGRQRIAEVAMRHRHTSARDLVRVVWQELEAFARCQPLADDVTLVVCRITGYHNSIQQAPGLTYQGCLHSLHGRAGGAFISAGSPTLTTLLTETEIEYPASCRLGSATECVQARGREGP